MIETTGGVVLEIEETDLNEEDQQGVVIITTTEGEMIDLSFRGVKSLYKAAIQEKDAGVLGGPRLNDLLKIISNERDALDCLRKYVNGVEIRREFGVSK